MTIPLPKVCFACYTEFHLLTAFILAVTQYRDHEKTILVCSNVRTEKFLHNLEDVQVWERVIIIPSDLPHSAFKEQIQEITSAGLDVLHYFAWGYHIFNDLFVWCVEHGKEIILTDEGIGTYAPFLTFEQWKQESEQNLLVVKGVDFSKVQSASLFDPRLYADPTPLITNKIDITGFVQILKNDLDLFRRFKWMFGFDDNLVMDYDVLYFRQYWSRISWISQEAEEFIESRIFAGLKGQRFGIKNHPALPHVPSDFQANIFTHPEIPWEVLLLIHQVDPSLHLRIPSVLISQSSSALFKTVIMGSNLALIFTFKFFQPYSVYDKHHDIWLDSFKKYYPDTPIFIPESWQEFQDVLSQYHITFDGKLIDPCDELSWLQKTYLKTWGNVSELKIHLGHLNQTIIENQVKYQEERVLFNQQQASLLQALQELDQTHVELAVLQQELDKTRANLYTTTNELLRIQSSKGMKLLNIFYAILRVILPENSIRRLIVAKGFHLIFTVVRYPFRKGSAYLKDHGFFNTAIRLFTFPFHKIYKIIRARLHKRELAKKEQELWAPLTSRLAEGDFKFIDIVHVPLGWNTQLFQRFQHITIQAARMGGLALYGAHPTVDHIDVMKEVSKNLIIVNMDDPEIRKKFFNLLDKQPGLKVIRLQSIDLVTTIEEIEQFMAKGYTILYEYIDEINPKITGTVPDHVFKRHEYILKNERIFAVATSDKLYSQLIKYRKVKTAMITNGVDYQHWVPDQQNATVPEDIRPVLAAGKKIVAYHGALASWIDYELLRQIANTEKYVVLLIGYDHDKTLTKSGVMNNPNIFYIGPKLYQELGIYASFYDIAIIPFLRNEITESVSPVKLFEYMAAGKPIVSYDLPECKKYQSCLIASNRDEFLQCLDQAVILSTDPQYRQLLLKEALENTWEAKASDMMHLIYDGTKKAGI